MNYNLYQYSQLSDELSELLEAFELKLQHCSTKLRKARFETDAEKVTDLLKEVKQWNTQIKQSR